MNQLRIINDSIKSFVISTGGRNLKGFISISRLLDVLCSFSMTKPEFILLSNTPLNPLSRGDFWTLSFIHEYLLLRVGQELCP